LDELPLQGAKEIFKSGPYSIYNLNGK